MGPGWVISKRGPETKMTFSKNNTGPFEVSLEVFLARSEALWRRFDLHRVVCFTYAHNVHCKQCVPFKRRSMGLNGVPSKREKHPPFSSVLMRSLDLGLGSPSRDLLGPNRFTPLVRFWLGGSCACITPPPLELFRP